MKKSEWAAYGKLAWTETILCSPQELSAETELYCRVIKDHPRIEPQSLLHLGCGAGYHDYIFKKHFKVTGVDLSYDMLKLARRLNPEVNYLRGDMRTIKLSGMFDAVAIPDSIGYMTTIANLQKAIGNAYQHLRPGGVLLIVALVRENFKPNNFVYSGSIEDVSVTLFENNYIPDSDSDLYEATFIYLIRRKGKLKIYTDYHKSGLFKQETWLGLLTWAGFKVEHKIIDHIYDQYIMENGEYDLSMYICTKPL